MSKIELVQVFECACGRPFAPGLSQCEVCAAETARFFSDQKEYVLLKYAKCNFVSRCQGCGRFIKRQQESANPYGICWGCYEDPWHW